MENTIHNKALHCPKEGEREFCGRQRFDMAAKMLMKIAMPGKLCYYNNKPGGQGRVKAVLLSGDRM